MTKFILTAENLQAVLNYLAERPWKETNNLIIEFSKLEKIEEQKKEDINPSDNLK